MRPVLTSDDPTTLLSEEIRSLNKNEKNSLFKYASVTPDISLEQGLTIKVDLTLPWNKLRMIRRLVLNKVCFTLQCKVDMHIRLEGRSRI